MISLQFQAKCTVCKAETTFARQVRLQEGFGGMLSLQLNPALPLLPLGWDGELNHTNATLERVTCPDCVRAKKRGEKQPEEAPPRPQEAPEQLSLYVTCHLPLVALSGGEECPRCGALAQDHRQWAEPRLRAQQVK